MVVRRAFEALVVIGWIALGLALIRADIDFTYSPGSYYVPSWSLPFETVLFALLVVASVYILKSHDHSPQRRVK